MIQGMREFRWGILVLVGLLSITSEACWGTDSPMSGGNLRGKYWELPKEGQPSYDNQGFAAHDPLPRGAPLSHPSPTAARPMDPSGGAELPVDVRFMHRCSCYMRHDFDIWAVDPASSVCEGTDRPEERLQRLATHASQDSNSSALATSKQLRRPGDVFDPGEGGSALDKRSVTGHRHGKATRTLMDRPENLVSAFQAEEDL
jgi:hypothetical protein